MRKILIAILLFATTVITSCTNNSNVITDKDGNALKLPKKIERIISASPSNSEIISELGLADKLVLVDEYSTSVDGINENIQKMDFMKPDLETIISLKPDILFASGINILNGQDPFAQLKESGITIIYTSNGESVNDVYDDVNYIAKVTNTTSKGDEIVSNLKAEIDKIQKISAGITDKKTVYFEISPKPSIYSFGSDTFTNELLEIAGGVNIFEDQKSWITPSEESIIAANPDVILTSVSYTEDPISEIKIREGWEHVNAITNEQVFFINPDNSNRSAPTLIKGIQDIAQALYPELYK